MSGWRAAGGGIYKYPNSVLIFFLSRVPHRVDNACHYCRRAVSYTTKWHTLKHQLDTWAAAPVAHPVPGALLHYIHVVYITPKSQHRRYTPCVYCKVLAYSAAHYIANFCLDKEPRVVLK